MLPEGAHCANRLLVSGIIVCSPQENHVHFTKGRQPQSYEKQASQLKQRNFADEFADVLQ
jgi:hypothetical protein